MISAVELLEPIAGQDPCGSDLSYNSAFTELEVSLDEKPESSADGKPEEPEWRKVQASAVKLFRTGKHLRVATILTVAALKLDGIPGFQQGIAVVRGLLEKHWEGFYPRLDPEDHNDPTERVNILGSFTAAPGGMRDVMNFQYRLRNTVLCRTKTADYSAADITRSEAGEAGAPPVSDIRAGFAEADPGELAAVREALVQTLEDIGGIQDFLRMQLGSASGRSWEGLSRIVAELLDRVTTYAPAGQTPDPGVVEAPRAAAAAGSAGGNGAPGGIQSRGEVVRSLEVICHYYKQSEPSSPIPLLLRCAQRLVDKDFLQIMEQLTPDALSTLKQIAGGGGDESK